MLRSFVFNSVMSRPSLRRSSWTTELDIWWIFIVNIIKLRIQNPTRPRRRPRVPIANDISACSPMPPKLDTRRSERAREVAEILYNSSHDHSLSEQHSTNTVMVSNNLHDSLLSHRDYIHEAVTTGHSIEGRMSAVRRFFCLYVTFDLMFTSLIWIICFVVSENLC